MGKIRRGMAPRVVYAVYAVPSETMMIEINSSLSLPENELELETSTSSGPGGQNVNKVETRVTVLFDVVSSPSLEEEQRDRILDKLSSRINKEGVLRVSSQEHRSQSANREEAMARLVELLREALRKPRRRRKTRRSKASHRRRLERKKQRSQIKRLRSNPKLGDG